MCAGLSSIAILYTTVLLVGLLVVAKCIYQYPQVRTRAPAHMRTRTRTRTRTRIANVFI